MEVCPLPVLLGSVEMKTWLTPGTAATRAAVLRALIGADQDLHRGKRCRSDTPFSRVCSAVYAGPFLANDFDDAKPILMPKNTLISANSAINAEPAAIHRRRTTSAAHLPQNLLARFSCRMRGQSTLGPIPPRIAGVNVSVVSTLASVSVRRRSPCCA